MSLPLLPAYLENFSTSSEDERSRRLRDAIVDLPWSFLSKEEQDAFLLAGLKRMRPESKPLSTTLYKFVREVAGECTY